MKRLNVKLVIWMIVIGAVLLGAIVGLHGFQMGRNSQQYLKLAEQAEKEKEYADAVAFYDQYLKYHPDEAKVQAKFALLLTDLAERPEATAPLQFKALGSLKNALRLDGKNAEVRGRLARFLLRGQRIDDAVTELEILRKAEPTNTEWQKLLAECRLRIGKHTEAVELLRSVIANDPKDVRSYSQLAAIQLRFVDDKEAANQVLDEMVAANPDSWLAHLIRFEFRSSEGRKEQAAEDLARALELGPDELDVRLAAAGSAIAAKEYAKANEHLEHAASKHPKEFKTYQNLAGLARMENKPDQAIAQLDRGLKELPESAELWEAMFLMQLATNDLEKARGAIDAMKKLQVRPEYLDQFRSQIFIREGKHTEALRTLNSLRPKVVAAPQLLLAVDMLRAECYGALSQTDLQIEAYRQVLFSNPSYLAARRLLGNALWLSGQTSEAMAELSAVAAGGDGMALLSLLQVAIQQQLRLPAEERNWEQCDDLVNQLEKLLPDKSRMTALRIDYLARKGDFAGARQLLDPLTQSGAQDLGLWIVRIDLATEEHGVSAGREELKAAKTALRDVLPLKQAEIGLLIRQGDDASKKALEELAAGLDKQPEADRKSLRAGLVNAFSVLGDRARAFQLVEEIAKEQPNDLNIRLSAFRLAREMGDDKLMQQSLQQIKSLMGENSTFWQYGEAARVVSAVGRNQRPVEDLKTARKLLDGPLAQRPNWGALYSLLGEIEQRQGNIDEAILRYQRAFDLGEQNGVTVRSLVVLMVLRNRAAEAEAVVNRIPRAREVLGPRVMAMLDMMLGRQKEAIESATAAVESAADDYSTQMWYGNVMLRHGKFPEAEKALLKARELADNVPDVWLALVNFYAVTKNLDAAKKVIEQAESKIPADQKERVLATAYDLVQDNAKAGPLFELAMKKAPNDLNLLRQYAQFQGKAIQGNTGDPKKLLETLTVILDKSNDAGPAAEPSARWARRTLAKITASGGQFQDLRNALKIIDGTATQFPPDSDDQSLKADALSRLRDVTARTEAIRLLSDNVAKDPERIEDQVALAALFNRSGDRTSSKGTMLTVLKLRPNEGRWMLVYADMLLQHGELTDAAALLDKYEKEITPKFPLYTSLRSRLLALQDQPEQSIAMAKSLITPPLAPDQIPQLKQVAAMLQAFAANASNPEPYYEAAGNLYREYVKEVPDDILDLATFTGLHGSIEESLKICEEVIAKGTPDKELVLQKALIVARARVKELSEAQKQQIQGWLDAAIQEKPAEPNRYVLLADFYDLQGKYDESEKIYRDLISNEKLTGNLRATVLNNLAYLLAVKDNQGKEALPYIEEAIAIVGPISEFLDTRGMVQLSLGDTKLAVQDLKLSSSDSPSPVKCLHLAIALLTSEDESGAAEAFKQAVQLGLKPDDVTSLERAHYDSLKAKFPTELSSTK